jgi:hypothetical protein
VPWPVFAWRYLDGGDQEVGSSETFPDQEAAEAWLGEAWPGLLQQGVELVVLVDRERGDAIYRMSLREA